MSKRSIIQDVMTFARDARSDSYLAIGFAFMRVEEGRRVHRDAWFKAVPGYPEGYHYDFLCEAGEDATVETYAARMALLPPDAAAVAAIVLWHDLRRDGMQASADAFKDCCMFHVRASIARRKAPVPL